MEKNKLNTNNKSIILFDGYCNLCSWSVRFIIERDSKDYFRFASLQSKVAKEILSQTNLPADFDQSVVLFENKKIFYNSDAALRIVKNLQGYWRYLYSFIYIPRFIRDFIYKIIARNRYKWFGIKDVCFVPKKDMSYKFLRVLVLLQVVFC